MERRHVVFLWCGQDMKTGVWGTKFPAKLMPAHKQTDLPKNKSQNWIDRRFDVRLFCSIGDTVRVESASLGFWDIHIHCLIHIMFRKRVVCSNRHGKCCFSSTCPAPLFTKRTYVLPPNLVKYRSRGIACYDYCITLKSDKHLSSDAAEVPVKL